MNIHPTGLSGVFVIGTSLISDHRGAFSRLFCRKELAAVIGVDNIMQINHSQTKAVGAIRGLHYQNPPYAEKKFIRCIKGRIWDVVVDLRKGSSTFLQWHAEELTPENAKMMVVPEGCAHGFQVLEEDSELLYLHTAVYVPESEGGVLYNEPKINIPWPLIMTDLSLRDTGHKSLPVDYKGIIL